MPELFGEGPVVIASDGDQFGRLAEIVKKLFDPGTLGVAGTRGVYQVAQEDDARGLQFFTKGEQLFA